MGTHLRVLREMYPINTSMAGFRWCLEIFAKITSALDGRSSFICILHESMPLIDCHTRATCGIGNAILVNEMTFQVLCKWHYLYVTQSLI